MNPQYLGRYIQDMKEFCLKLNNREIIQCLLATVAIAELAQKIMIFGGYSKKNCEYRQITSALEDDEYEGDLSTISLILQLRTDIVHLYKYKEAVSAISLYSTATFEDAFDEILNVYKYIIKKHTKRLKSNLDIGNDFITSILKIGIGAESEVAVTKEQSEGYQLLYNYVKKLAPRLILESESYGETEEERVLQFVKGQLK